MFVSETNSICNRFVCKLHSGGWFVILCLQSSHIQLSPCSERYYAEQYAWQVAVTSDSAEQKPASERWRNHCTVAPCALFLFRFLLRIICKTETRASDCVESAYLWLATYCRAAGTVRCCKHMETLLEHTHPQRKHSGGSRQGRQRQVVTHTVSAEAHHSHSCTNTGRNLNRILCSGDSWFEWQANQWSLWFCLHSPWPPWGSWAVNVQ